MMKWFEHPDFFMYACPDCGGKMEVFFHKQTPFHCAVCNKNFATFESPPLPEMPDPYEVTYG
jgi:ribosomal protein S27E